MTFSQVQIQPLQKMIIKNIKCRDIPQANYLSIYCFHSLYNLDLQPYCFQQYYSIYFSFWRLTLIAFVSDPWTFTYRSLNILVVSQVILSLSIFNNTHPAEGFLFSPSTSKTTFNFPQNHLHCISSVSISHLNCSLLCLTII